MPRATPAATLLFLAGMLVPGALHAQGENALPMPSGSFRVSIGADWAHYTNRFGTASPAHPGQPDGTVEPIGVDFGSDSLGAQQLTFLVPVQNQLRALTGLPGYAIDIGNTRLVLDASVRHQPIRIAWAPSSRLAFQVMVPIVRSRMSAFLGLPQDTSTSAHGNVGAITPTAFDPFRLSVDSALRALRSGASTGPTGQLQAKAESALTRLSPLLCGLSNLASQTTDPNSPCFGGPAPAPFLPLGTSVAGESISVQLGRAQLSYDSVRLAYQSANVTIPTLSLASAYALPTAPLDSTALRALLINSGGIGGDSLSEVVRTGIGDIEVGGWYQLANSPSWRSQVALTVRLPTGKMDDPNNLIDIGTGDHQLDVEVGFRNDFILNKNLWVHAGGRYAVQMSDNLDRRVAPWYAPYAPDSSLANVNRKLGDYYAIDLVPNWQLDDALNFGLGWHYFHQAASTFSYANPADAIRIGLPASDLGLATSETYMRIGAGLTFSTLERFEQHRARLPYRVTWSYNSTIWGRGGQTPKSGVMII
ncbi:MAG TPA: hypothetical protein VGI92_13420, partial [Gemmatimonadales bacterium]